MTKFVSLLLGWVGLGVEADIVVMVFTKWIGPRGLTGSFPLGDRCLNNLLGLFILTGVVFVNY
jgi:hypothetical protein